MTRSVQRNAKSGANETEALLDPGLEALSSAECACLLDAGGVGILAIAGDDVPLLRPVNFAAVPGWLVIRTGEGQIRAAAESITAASFAVVSTDPVEHTGWSVVVTGALRLLSPTDELDRIPLRPWARGAERRNFVALSMEQVSGRRIAQPREDV